MIAPVSWYRRCILAAAVASLSGVALAGCGGASPAVDLGPAADRGADLAPSGDRAVDVQGSLDGADDGPRSTGDGPRSTGDGAGPAAPKTVLYAHTDTTLYQVDPTVTPFTLTSLGDFDCVGRQGAAAMVDLAVDKLGRLSGTTGHRLYHLTIDPGGVIHCDAGISLEGQGTYYGLTYAPEGVLGPNEILIAANSAGELWAIDEQGTQTQVGTLGVVPSDDGRGHTYNPSHVGKAWELSGDIILLANNGHPIGFATVRDCPSPPDTTGCSQVDTLIQLEVGMIRMGNTGSVLKAISGQAVPDPSCPMPSSTSGFGSFYGIAAYEDKVYGFSRRGDIVEMNNTTGAGCLLQQDSSMGFAGAAATTVIPVIAPHPEG